MENVVDATQEAIKKETPVTLDAAICQLRMEYARINQELSALLAAQWLEPHGQQLANREQELHVTLGVLRRWLAEHVAKHLSLKGEEA